jgi:hypothetical protein
MGMMARGSSACMMVDTTFLWWPMPLQQQQQWQQQQQQWQQQQQQHEMREVSRCSRQRASGFVSFLNTTVVAVFVE